MEKKVLSAHPRELLRFPSQPSPSEGTSQFGTPQNITTWELIRDLPPHKIFLWDQFGKYLDFSFPNPLYGHFLGPRKLEGSTLTDVLPDETAQAILEKIQATLTTQEPEFLTLKLPRPKGRTFQTLIRFFPLSNHVLGLVNDFPSLTISPSALMPHASSSEKGRALPQMKHPLTFREQQIILALGKGYSNESIATNLGISLRTVKFHLLNLYPKFGVSSRTTLESLAVFLLSVSDSRPKTLAFFRRNSPQRTRKTSTKIPGLFPQTRDFPSCP